MSKYEYKDTIQDSIIHYYDHALLYREYTDDVLDELDHVYAQSAKADEYETKAEAWDAMKKDFEDIADTPIGQQILFNMSIIKERVERRDSNA